MPNGTNKLIERLGLADLAAKFLDQPPEEDKQAPTGAFADDSQDHFLAARVRRDPHYRNMGAGRRQVRRAPGC
jgi:hypothetical protein